MEGKGLQTIKQTITLETAQKARVAISRWNAASRATSPSAWPTLCLAAAITVPNLSTPTPATHRTAAITPLGTVPATSTFPIAWWSATCIIFPSVKGRRWLQAVRCSGSSAASAPVAPGHTPPAVPSRSARAAPIRTVRQPWTEHAPRSHHQGVRLFSRAHVTIHESVNLEFRWEMFNMFNTTQFAFPRRDCSSGSAGTITSLASDPRVMHFALRLKF
jgi:hypothetical protein